MAITSISQLEDATSGRFTKIIVNKTTVNGGNHGAGFNVSYWLAGGTPGAGNSPTTSIALLTNASTGAIPFAQQASGRTSYLVELNAATPGTISSIEIHDRIMHIASTAQTTTQALSNFDLNSYLGSNNIAARIGDANYSDVQWWVENHINGTNTSINLTINVTYNDGTTGNLTLTGYLNFRQGRMFALNSLIPAADSGKFIRAINNVTSSATIATNGISFTATRYRAAIFVENSNGLFKTGWTDTGMPEIYNQSCLFAITTATATTVGDIRVDGIIAHG